MKYYVVDAFAETVFTGNPTGVCLLGETTWPHDALLLNITAEISLPETAYVLKQGDSYAMRWFAPNAEIDLCGHGTLAAGYVLCNFVEPDAAVINFQTGAGPLTVERKGELYELDLPSRVPQKAALTQELIDALGGTVPIETYTSRDYFFLLDSEDAVRALKPDFGLMRMLGFGDGVIVTARGSQSDFVTRAFFPKLLTDEDPVCGSAHCNLIPFWAERLGKTVMVSHQLSARSGVIYCRLMGDRIRIAGKAALFSKGEILV